MFTKNTAHLKKKIWLRMIADGLFWDGNYRQIHVKGLIFDHSLAFNHHFVEMKRFGLVDYLKR